jgi:cation-transporting ATPase E
VEWQVNPSRIGASVMVGSPPRAPAPADGLTAAEVAQRVAAGQANDATEPSSRSLASIVRANVLTPFNALLGSLCAVVLALGSYQDALFGIVIVVNTVIGIVQEVRAKRTLDALSLIGLARARVRRDGEVVEVDPREVVLDDVLVVGPGDKIVVDGTVLTSDGLEVDESLLTGEAEPVPHPPGDRVLSGSFVVAGTGSYRAVGVGRAAYAARLAAEARQFSLVHSELRTGLNRFLRGVTWFLVPTSVLLTVTQLLQDGQGVRSALLGSVAGVVTMVPEGLILLTSIAFAVGVVRLGRRRVLVQELPAIEGLARVDVVCIDKTGTLTEPRMGVADVVALDAGLPVAEALAAVAAADTAPNSSLRAIAEGYPEDPGWPVAQRVPFSSARRWSGCEFGDGRGAWALGAPDVLLPADSPVVARAAEHARQGLRVLLLARADGLPEEGPLPGLRPAALVLLEQPVRPDAAATLRYFAGQGVTVKVLSGDNPETVGAIAGRLGIPGAATPYDARELPEDPARLAELLEEASVFGRVAPEQKRAVVGALRAHGHVVAMLGDGVNDVLALKTADLGVAMGNGSDATRAVAQVVLLDSRFADLPSVVDEGRRVIGNIERVAHLFLTKTAYACVMALVVGVAQLPFPFLPRHLTLVGSLTIGIPAFFLALAPNRARVRPGFVRRVLRRAVPAGVLAAAATLATFALTRVVWSAGFDQARTASVVALFAVSAWVLAMVARPLNPWKSLLVAAMVGLFALALAVPFARDFFALETSGLATGAAVATGCAAVAVLALELVWRGVSPQGKVADARPSDPPAPVRPS